MGIAVLIICLFILGRNPARQLDDGGYNKEQTSKPKEDIQTQIDADETEEGGDIPIDEEKKDTKDEIKEEVIISTKVPEVEFNAD